MFIHNPWIHANLYNLFKCVQNGVVYVEIRMNLDWKMLYFSLLVHDT